MKKGLGICMLLILLCWSLKGQENGGSVNTPLEKVTQWFAKFEEYLGRTDVITPGELQRLPIGLRTTFGNTNYDLLVTQAIFGPATTELAVYLRISGPDWQGGKRTLYFGADKVLISSGGGFVGDVKLALMGEVCIKGKGDMFTLRLVGRKDEGDHVNTSDGLPPTYAIVNCNGFKEMQLSAVLELNGKHFAAVKDGELIEDPLSVPFFCVASALDDIVVKVNLPEFALRSVSDWSFLAEEATFDFSQTRNAPGFEGYGRHKGSDGDVDFGEIWQGFYLKKIRLRFPDYIKKRGGASLSVAVEKMWIDEKGFTGNVALENILHLGEGSLGGWGFSIEKFEMDFVQNRLAGGGMEGEIDLPVSKANAYRYEAGFETDGSWNMRLGLEDKVRFEFMKSREVEIYKTSYLQAKKENGKPFSIKACLSGKMKFNPTAAENDRFGFANLEFKNMKVSNVEPYFEVDKISWDDELKIKNFPVSIKDIEVTGKMKDISLSFKTRVHFGSQEDCAFGGELGLGIHSAVEQEDGKQKWKFKKVAFTEAAVEFSNTFLKFKGGVRLLDNDPVYGNGFQGNVDFSILPLNFGLRADLMLGSTTFRYWYVDIMAQLGPTGIPVFPGFKIAAIGGGAYKKMKLGTPSSSSAGKTLTGLTYVPDSTRSFGLKTSLVLASIDEKMFNAELTMEMAFNRSGGLADMYLRGAGQMMSSNLEALKRFNQKVTQLASAIQPSIEDQQRAVASEAAISAQVELHMDVENRIFTGNFDAFMDLGVIKGSGTRGRLGKLGMSFGGGDWYIKVGEPAHPLGVKMKVGPIQASLDAYFMTGSRLPDFPAVPAKVARLLGHSQYDRPNLSELKQGTGLAFGSSFKFGTGTIPLLLFYASFDAELGFDVMLKQHLNSLCAETGTKPGINGWYAQGQAYSYLMADVGLYLKLFGKPRNFSILKGEVGAMLKAGLPNPASFSGGFGVNVSILNGLVRGRFHVEFDLGQECTVLNQGFADGAEIIAELSPADGAEKVDVFSVPQAAFNLPLETEIDEEYDNERKLLKLNLDRYELWYGGTRIEGKFKWNEDKRLVEFVSHDVLPANARLDYKLAVKAKEKKGASWTDLKTDGGDSYQEERKYAFTTGEGPDSIPWSNVKYCYPVRDQQFFLPREYKKGFVFLEKGMSELLTAEDYGKRVYIVSAQDTLEASFTYNKAENRIWWFMPDGLQPQTEYELLLVLQYRGTDRPLVSAGNSHAAQSLTQQSGVQTAQTALYEGQGGTLSQETVNLKTGSLLKSDKDKVVLRYSFTTSRYSDFGSKMAAVRLTETFRTPLLCMAGNGQVYTPSPDVHYLQANMKTEEGFEQIELSGNRFSGSQPLIRPLADLGNEPYYNETIYPLVYKEYPYGGNVCFERDAAHAGTIPDWAVYASELYAEKDRNFFPWIYYLVPQYKADFDQVLRGVAHAGISALPYHYAWLWKNFVPIKKGSYPIELRYVLPDGTVTSVRRAVFENNLD